MFFIYEEGIFTKYVVGGAATLSGAKKLAEERAKRELDWYPNENGYRAEVDFGTYKIYYQIDQKEER